MPVLSTITDDHAEQRLDRYLRQQFPQLSLAAIQRSIRKRQIRINDQRITAGDYRLQEGDQLNVPQYFLEQQPNDNIAPNIGVQNKLQAMLIADTAQYFVLNKPAGLAVQGGTGVRWHLDRLLPQLALLFGDDPHSLHLVHRLDRDTSGLLLVARGRQAAQQLGAAFREQRIQKEYWAICDGIPNPSEGCLDQAIGKIPHLKGDSRMGVMSGGMTTSAPQLIDIKSAKTLYRVIDQSTHHALVQLQPITGRKHQLRVHLAALGTPIVGDRLYGHHRTAAIKSSLGQSSSAQHTPAPMCLHARWISVPDLADPADLKFYQVEPPEDWLAYAKAKKLVLPSTCQPVNILASRSKSM